MKTALTLITATAIALSASPSWAGFKRIKTKEAYVAAVVGQKLTDDKGNWYVINSDGTLTGQAGGKKVRGAWNWQKGFWCRNVVVGKKELGTDCQLVELEGKIMRSTRNKGKGDSVLLTIN